MYSKKRKASDVFAHSSYPNKTARHVEEVQNLALARPNLRPLTAWLWGTLSDTMTGAFAAASGRSSSMFPLSFSPRPLAGTSSPTTSTQSTLPPPSSQASVSDGDLSHTSISSAPRRHALSRSHLATTPKAISRTRRPHVHHHLFDASRKKEIEQKLYLLERAEGYTSDFSTFRFFLQYKALVEQQGNGPTIDFPGRAPYSNISNNTRDLEHLQSQALQMALDRAKDSLNGPGPPKPYVPTFDQLRVADKAKDRAIEKRLRPPLPAQLPPEAQEEVNRILNNPRFTSKAGREQVHRADILRLQPGAWLNDEVINFYGQLIVDRAAAHEGGKENIENRKQSTTSKLRQRRPLKIHYFNTYFWPKVQIGYKQSNLKKWTKKVDIFSKDVILIPVNHSNAHWSAAVINFAAKRIESYDSLDLKNSRKGMLFQQLRSYIREEYRDKKGGDFDFTGWIDYGRPDTPQQENGFDCGVFTTQFLESVAKGDEGFSFSQKDMLYLRQRMIWEIGRAKLGDDR